MMMSIDRTKTVELVSDPNPSEMNLEDKVMELQGKWRCPKCDRYLEKRGYRPHVTYCKGKAEVLRQPCGRPSRSKNHVCPFCNQEFFGKAINSHRLTCLQNPERFKYLNNLRQLEGMTQEEYVRKFGSLRKSSKPNPPQVEIKTADGSKFIFDAEDSL